MRRTRTVWLLAPTLVVACAGNPDRQTLATLRHVEPNMTEVLVEDGLDQAMLAYRHFLQEAPKSALTPEAMRRLADLKLEKEYGFLDNTVPESEGDFETRAASEEKMSQSIGTTDLALPGGEEVAWSGPLEAIELYDRILASYPNYEHNDQVLYQKARAYDELGRNDEAVAVIERLVAKFPESHYIDEVQFRRAEYFFTRRKYLDAEESYQAVVRMGTETQYYELALYKLGWTLYKQELHEEALQQYLALLDHKVSTGYDFDQKLDETDERRIADTYRVISLSFSNLGGPEAVVAYFEANGRRSYEDRIYRQLGEFYLEKLRYHDAAAVYQTFVGLNPYHRSSPHFGIRVVEIHEKGGFPKLVLESKKDFAARYGLASAYWQHFDVAEAPEVRSYLKGNLKDLANHYHALYQEEALVDAKPQNFEEGLHWYRAYLASFPSEPETPATHHQLADLLLEHEDFGAAALEYERTAYDYPQHEQAAGAGYAAIYAHREHQQVVSGEQEGVVKREAVTSTLRFVDTFSQHEHAATVLGAAVDDLYDMKQYERAIGTAQRLITDYPVADLSITRSAWAVVAHSSFELASYEPAESAYLRVLALTEEDDATRQGVVENLAATIYKQGEAASLAEEHRLAADHFLRIKQVAPTSEIRPVAEYDASSAMIRLEDWAGAAAVLESFRETHPDHELNHEATKQVAFVYRQDGNLGRAAQEYERVAAEAEDTQLRRDALLLAGELYEESEVVDRALAVYLSYVDEFPTPIEVGVETRFKIAEIYASKEDEARHHEQLKRIVKIDATAGDERSERVRYLAARSALVLSEGAYHRFAEIELVQPFERNLKKKQRRMDAALEQFGKLVDYEVGEVTAAATYYMAEVYFEFSQSLMESERPSDLDVSELQDYEMVLEEEAFPFEERAIDVHEKNLELMSAGVYNGWIDKSLGKLAVMMPGRYAKFEASSGLIASIDSYAYRAPNAGRAGEAILDDATGSDLPDSQPVSGSETETAREGLAEAAVAAG